MEKDDNVGKINGIIRTRENSSMSLSCVGEIVVKDNVVQSVYWHGYPRANGIDVWVSYYDNLKIGDEITQEILRTILSYNGRNNIISSLN